MEISLEQLAIDKQCDFTQKEINDGTVPESEGASQPRNKIAERLTILQQLHDQGPITDKKFEGRHTEILSAIYQLLS